MEPRTRVNGNGWVPHEAAMTGKRKKKRTRTHWSWCRRQRRRPRGRAGAPGPGRSTSRASVERTRWRRRQSCSLRGVRGGASATGNDSADATRAPPRRTRRRPRRRTEACRRKRRDDAAPERQEPVLAHEVHEHARRRHASGPRRRDGRHRADADRVERVAHEHAAGPREKPGQRVGCVDGHRAAALGNAGGARMGRGRGSATRSRNEQPRLCPRADRGRGGRLVALQSHRARRLHTHRDFRPIPPHFPASSPHRLGTNTRSLTHSTSSPSPSFSSSFVSEPPSSPSQDLFTQH